MYQNVFFGDVDVTKFFCEMINRRKCFKPYFQAWLLLKLRIFKKPETRCKQNLNQRKTYDQ